VPFLLLLFREDLLSLLFDPSPEAGTKLGAEAFMLMLRKKE
jgi:hypothetical protein